MLDKKSVAAAQLPEKSSVALKAFFAIAHKWKLTTNQERVLLGNIPSATFYRWKQQKGEIMLSADTLERISYVLGIYKALRILLPEKAANQWIHKPNAAPLFGGKSALEKMMKGHVVDLADIRRYLDAERG